MRRRRREAPRVQRLPRQPQAAVGIVRKDHHGSERGDRLQGGGGAEFFATHIKTLRAENPNTLAATLKIDDVVVDPAKEYRITVNAFLADGGDGFAILKSGTTRTAGGLDLDALLAYFTAHPSLTPPATKRVTKL